MTLKTIGAARGIATVFAAGVAAHAVGHDQQVAAGVAGVLVVRAHQPHVGRRFPFLIRIVGTGRSSR